MKLLIVAGATAIVSLGLWTGTDRLATVDLEPDPRPTASIGSDARGYSVTNIVAQTACLVERSGKLSGRSMRFSAEADCERVWPGLSKAETWTQTGDGTIVVADARGEAIITVVEGDGLAYEALEPPDAMLTMISTD